MSNQQRVVLVTGASRGAGKGIALAFGSMGDIVYVTGRSQKEGDAPLPGHPIRIRRIPGQAGRYAAERNYLVLERQGADWSASWELETSGRSAPLAL